MRKIALTMLSLSLVGTIALQPVLSQVSLGVSDVATEGAQGTDVSASQRVNSADGITNVTDEFGRTLSDRANALMAGGEYAQYASSHESRKVIVELDGKSLSEDFLSLGAVSAYKSLSDYALSAAGKKLSVDRKAEQDAFLQTLDREGIPYSSEYSYSGIVNGVALTVKESDLSAISSIRGVRNIIFSEQYSVPTADAVFNPVNAYSTGIYDTTGISYTGSGVVVAILDTGLDYTHNAFKTMPKVQTLTKDKVAEAVANNALAAQTRVADVDEDDLYYNAKVPFQFDYADNDADVFPVASSHGTHVAGIITGYEETVDYTPLPSDTNMYFNTNENGDPTFKGVAVDAQLAIFKVFSDDVNDTGGETVDIIAALNDAALLDVDVINMSLGMSCGFSRVTDDESVNKIYDTIREMGISLIVAAGNSYSSAFNGTYGNTNLATNPDSGTVSSPSIYNGALSVASVSGQLSPYFLANNSVAVYFNNARNSAGQELDFLNTLLGDAKSKTFNYVVVGGYGENHNYTSDIRAKFADGNTIAVVSRGNTSFEDKQKVAASYGAIGCIIYNNASGVINASVGTGYKIPTCTITMDIAKQFISQREGTITLDQDYKAGPFMSDFSSWGTTSDLRLFPDVTAHGGFITSAVLGGYGVYSGTSMATPNVAGISTLIRQYLAEKYPEKSKRERNELMYQLLMSTATIALNEEGNPYSPRKQGAGLADIKNTINADAYLYVKGSDKTKLELGDDPDREGKYTLRFRINNTSAVAKTYELDKYVMTETMSSDGITVAEKAYLFNDAVVKLAKAGEGVTYADGILTVAGNTDAELVFTLTLTDEDKDYLNEHFTNGMFVEGYLRFIEQNSATVNIELSIPFMGFYGNWLDAPMFDKSAYDVSASYFDSSVRDEDKLQADVYESIVIGKYYRSRENYMSMGEYVMIHEDQDTPIVESSVDKIAVTGSDYGIYELYAVYAGLLRSAKSVKAVVSEAATGEVVYERTDYEVGKSREGGPALIELEIDPLTLNLKNNTKYNVTLTAALDYEGGENASGNTWEFSFYVDYEMPSLQDYEIRTVYDREDNETVYLDLYVSDNHYIECLQLFSSTTSNGSDLTFLTEYPIPVYGGRNTITKVTVDITDYIEAFKANRINNSSNQIGIFLQDYALNTGAYIIPLRWESVESISMKHEGTELAFTTIDLSVGDAYSYELTTLPSKVDPSALNISYANPGVVEVRDGFIYAKKAGKTTVTVTPLYPSIENYSYSFEVEVADKAAESVPAVSVYFDSYTLGAFKVKVGNNNVISLDSGVTSTLSLTYNPWYATPENLTWSSLTPDKVSVTSNGVMTTLDQGVGRISVSWRYRGVDYSTSLTIRIGEKYEIVSTYLYGYNGADSVVQIPANLGIMTIGHYLEGTAGPFYQNTVMKTLIVPSGVTTIGLASFCGCTNLETVFLPATLETIGESAFEGCSKLKNVYWYTEAYWDDDFNAYTFVDANGQRVRCFADDGHVVGGFEYSDKCTAKNINIRASAFYMCSALTAFDLSKATALYSQAFSSCFALSEIDISSVSYAESYVFGVCPGITSIKMSSKTMIGTAMFYANTALKSVDIYATSIGNQAFSDCTSLQEVNVYSNIEVIGARAFYNCSKLVNFYLHNNVRISRLNASVFGNCRALSTVNLNGVTYLGSDVFNNCSNLEEVNFGLRSTLADVDSYPFFGCSRLNRLTVHDGNRYLTAKTVTLGGTEYSFLYRGDALVLAPPAYRDTAFKLDTDEEGTPVTEIGPSAYAYSAISVDTLIIPEGVESIGDYAFYNCSFRTLVLPTTLQHLGDQVFAYNSALENVVFLGGDFGEIPYCSFFRCSALKQVSIPEGVTSIGMSAFRYCDSLGGITFPASMQSIGPFAFDNCISLENIKFAEGSRLELIDRNAFSNIPVQEIELPHSLKTLGNYAFYYTGLTSITVPNSIETFGNFAFAYCPDLTKITLEEGLSYVGYGAFIWAAQTGDTFYVNNRIRDIAFPDSLTIIGPYAFAGFSGFTSLDLNNVEYIGESAFMACQNLESVTADHVETVGINAFYLDASLVNIDLPAAVLINSLAFRDCTSLETVNIPNCQVLGSYAFYECENLVSVDMPNVSIFGAAAFYGCVSFEDAQIPSAELLGEAAFFATGIKHITLPATLSEMGRAVFAQCTYLEDFEIEEGNETFTTDGKGLYRNVPNGLELVAYAQGSPDTEYSVQEGTVRLGDWSLAYAIYLDRIELPSTLKSIGVGAMYYLGMRKDFSASGITYVFHSVDAPEVEGEFVENAQSFSQSYNSFGYDLGGLHFSIIYPSNGSGYDNHVYGNSFYEPTSYLPEAAERGTLALIDRIDALDPDALDGDEIAAIRRSYNMLSTTQKGFVTNYQKFTELEAAYNTAQQETPSEPPVTPPEEGEKGGCSGTIGIGSAALMLTVLLLGTLYIVLKKKGGNTK